MGLVLEDRPTVIVNEPADPDLARLWSLAQSKLSARLGKAPATRADVAAVTEEYHALIRKTGGVIVPIREVCGKAPGAD